MLSLLSLAGSFSTILMVVLALAALAALIYVPAPLKHYAVAALLIAAAASQIYGEGYRASEQAWQAKYDRAQAKYEADLAMISAADQKAASDALQAELSREQTNTAQLKIQLDAQAAAAAENEAQYQAILGEINTAKGDADLPAPGLILDAIRGVRK